MRYLPDGIQMKEADRDTIERIGVPSLVLMERAALKTVEAMEEKGFDTSFTLVVCGSGNNGGDGFAIARLLEERGKIADVFFAGNEASLSDECRAQKEIAEKVGIKVFKEFPDDEYTVVIDALFGVGLSREVTGRYLDTIEQMNRAEGRKVAVDIPSGICAGTGRVLGAAFRADLTVSMACVKLGCELFPGKEYAGETVSVPIGIDPAYFKERQDVCFTYDRSEIRYLLPGRRQNTHKGSYGKILMITGSKGMAGAACLAAKAAYTVGAGLVRIYTASENREVLQQLIPEAIISCYDEFDEEETAALLNWADVVCIGCGLGQQTAAEQLLVYTLKHVRVPCIIDADGINLLSMHRELLALASAPVILTPHMMEMSRLMGVPLLEIAEDRIRFLHQFTEKYAAVCVLKDSRTAVGCRGRQTFVNLAGNSAMAKAGSGDVLAGVISGLAAQGLTAFRAAALGVFLHACGGDEARDALGSYSVLAGDLITGIQTCMKKSEETDQ